MMRPPFLLALAMATTTSVSAEEPATITDLKQPPRIRIFASNLQTLYLDTNAVAKVAAPGETIQIQGKAGKSVTPVGSLFSMAKKNENVSIGMPASFASRTLKENTRFGAKPFYREFALVPGQLIRVSANFDGPNRRCVPADVKVQSRESLRFAPGPSITFTPEPGSDYEVSFGTDGQGCGITARQLLADGTTTPLSLEMKRQLSPPTYTVEGTHLYAFLFKPGNVAYRVVGERENLQLQLDSPEYADAFEAAMREIASRPGTQMCIVLPDFSYKSPLMDRLSRVMEEQGKAFPAILEPIAAMRTVQNTPDNVPTTFMAAASYCQLAGLMAFGGIPLPPAGPARPETPEAPVLP